ncbi:hypothetical protein llap_6071 [Limosa lapponica baueri]|uniref:L-aminoadipate-semialdehyde dehydrogenase-phosphopantetheinyl transferase n=1 Tax=Limosa lapponica baueri TaxID=1758121 RepID=A0A2I0UCA8_LIMLA|nr:hypothetical protein llap_6071 [Limosa lapponica baueri]
MAGVEGKVLCKSEHVSRRVAEQLKKPGTKKGIFIIPTKENRLLSAIVCLASCSSSIPNFFRIMKRQFTETEWGIINSMGNEWMQLDMFYRHWALKESFLKAIGVGIGFNLQRIEFHVSPLQLKIGKVYKETKMLLDGDKEEEWTFEETRLDDHHHVAVALGKQEGFGQKHSNVSSMEPDQPQFTLLTFEDLVASGIPVAPEDSADWDNFCSKQESPVKQNSHSR